MVGSAALKSRTCFPLAGAVFDLANSYGQLVADGDTTTTEVSAGEEKGEEKETF
jgi:hypothetical protein